MDWAFWISLVGCLAFVVWFYFNERKWNRIMIGHAVEFIERCNRQIKFYEQILEGLKDLEETFGDIIEKEMELIK